MTLMLELTPEQQSRLETAARQQGTSPDAYALRLVTEHLPPALPEAEEADPTLRLFAEWDREDALMTSAEIEQAQQEAEAFKTAINAEREQAGSRLVY